MFPYKGPFTFYINGYRLTSNRSTLLFPLSFDRLSRHRSIAVENGGMQFIPMTSQQEMNQQQKVAQVQI